MKPLLPLLLLVLAAASCRPGSHAPTAGSDADSLAADTPVTLFPDTAYASAAAVRYGLEVRDSAQAEFRPADSLYDCSRGVFTFRGTLLRDADFGGTVQGTPSRVDVEWAFQTELDTQRTKWGTWYGGTGWTGQPLYRKQSGEVIVGSLCGKVYFIDFATGRATRRPLDAGNPIKGTPSLDPELDNLYVGQGVPGRQPFGCMAFDLERHERTFFLDRDPKARRGWNAFDSSPVVAGGYLFWPGENGTLYKFARQRGGRLSLAAALRYTVGGLAPGIENSLCVCRNYAWFGDNAGNVLCVNLATMRPVWHYALGDDIDGTLVCRIEQGGTPMVYAACEVDKQGMAGICRLVKLNGLTGERQWEHAIPCNRVKLGSEKTLDGGIYCTPLPGRGDAEGLIFANVCRNGADGRGAQSGALMAFRTADGSEAYSLNYPIFAWSSPVGFTNERGEMFLLTGDASGQIYLVRARTGELIYKAKVGSNFESSPVVVGNSAIVGSRWNGIYKLTLK